jgi:hypothetical protein
MFEYSKRASVMFYVGFTLLLTSCATTRGENESSGMIIGGILGGVLGHEIGSGHGRTAATVIGTMIGTTIGGNVGRSMDKTDRLNVSRSYWSWCDLAQPRYRLPIPSRPYKYI